jgi:hypothetical protein
MQLMYECVTSEDFSKRFIGHFNSRVSCRVLYAVTVWGKCEDYPYFMYAAVLIYRVSVRPCLFCYYCYFSE